VEYQNISFFYDKDKPIFTNLNLTVDSGELIALVGASGSGKTTLVNLLLRFYEPIAGKILIDDRLDNILQWKSKNGIGLLYEGDTKKIITELKKLGL
jgi:ABC-type multidrug transport system fused ATPase/permease subunit